MQYHWDILTLLVYLFDIKNGITPVHICAKYGHDELLELLCDTYQADPNAASYVSFSTILHFCFYVFLAGFSSISHRMMLGPCTLLHRMAIFLLLICWSQSTMLIPTIQRLYAHIYIYITAMHYTSIIDSCVYFSRKSGVQFILLLTVGIVTSSRL